MLFTATVMNIRRFLSSLNGEVILIPDGYPVSFHWQTPIYAVIPVSYSMK